jgi:hypothetical protein
MLASQKKMWVSGQVSSIFRPSRAQVPSVPIEAYKAAVLADSPTAYYRLGELTGTSAADASGNSNTGTYEGTPALGYPSLLGNDPNTAVVFNGSTQDVLTASVPSIATATTAWSFDAWFMLGPGLTASGGQSLWCARNSTGGSPQILHILISATGTAQIVMRCNGNVGLVAPASTPKYNDLKRHHIAVTRTTGKVWTIYVDGVSVATATDTANSGFTSFDWTYIARNRTDNTWFSGAIDEVAIYNGNALSATRVLAHYQAGL